MLCKWCGMESATTDQCSWCHRPLSAAAAESAETGGREAGAPVSLRKGPLAIPMNEPAHDPQEGASVGRAVSPPRAPWMAAPPIPRQQAAGAGGSESIPKSPGAPNRVGARGGPRIPAPGMPPIRSSPAFPRDTPAAPRRHIPAPAILPISQQNRAGGAIPRSPYATAGPVVAPGLRPLMGAPPARALNADPALSSAQAHAASIADGMPVAEPGGLADGVAAPRSLSSADINLPAMGAGTAEQSKYYPGQVVDDTAGTQYESTAGKSADAPSPRKPGEVEILWESPVTSMSTLVMRYLCAFAGVLIITCLLAHAYREHYVIIMLAALFVSGLLLPVMNVVPKQRDDSDDVWMFFGLTMLFGPAIGLIIYAAFGLARQSANPAVMGCFVVSIVTQLAVSLAAAPTMLLIGPPWVQHGFDLRTLFINWSAFASMAGWASANVFHRFDE